MYEYSEDRVVVSDNLVTSCVAPPPFLRLLLLIEGWTKRRGPGTALEFSLKIVEILAGERKRDEVAGPMML